MGGFPSNLDYYKIGYDHNKAIYNMYRNDPQLFNRPNSTIITKSISSLNNMGYSSSLTTAEYLILTNSLNQSFESFRSYVASALRNTPHYSAISIIDTFGENVVQLTDNSQIVSYTNMIISEINTMGLSNANEIKAAISICGNSRVLWKEK